jgi:HK97 family phage prohead protease
VKNREVRFFKAEVRVKAEPDGPKKIVGYAARFNELSEVLSDFREKIEPGAFSEALKGSDVRGLFNHDPNHVLGRESAGTLELREDEKGLWYELLPPDTQWARDLLVSIERGDIKESSFAFTMEGGKDEWDDSVKPSIRTIKRIGALYDVSPVTFPAYPTASSGVRSAEEVFKEHESERKQASPVIEPDFFILRARLGLAEIE